MLAAEERAKRLAGLSGQRQRLLRLHLEGRVDETTFDTEDRRLGEEIRALEDVGWRDPSTAGADWDEVRERLTFATRVHATFDQLDEAGRAATARQMARRFVVQDGALTIDAYPWFLAVRTYVQSERMERDKLELRKIGSQSMREPDHVALVPAWCTLVENVRTAMNRSYALR